MDRLQIRQFVVVLVDTGAEEQAGVPAINDFQIISEFDKVGLMLLIPRSNEAVDLAFELLLFVVVVRAIPFREAGLASEANLSVLEGSRGCGSEGLLAVLNQDE